MTGLKLLVDVEPRRIARHPTAREEDEWTSRFANRLRTLAPLLSMLARHQKAVAAFAIARHLEPEDAAVIWGGAPLPTLQRVLLKNPRGHRTLAAEDTGMSVLRFVLRLRGLRPDVTLVQAREAALKALDFAGPTNAVEAAEAYAQAKLPADSQPGGD